MLAKEVLAKEVLAKEVLANEVPNKVVVPNKCPTKEGLAKEVEAKIVSTLESHLSKNQQVPGVKI